MPVLEVFLPPPHRRFSLAGRLLSIARMFVDVLGWAYNPSLLPILHEQFFQVSHQLECMVRLIIGGRIAVVVVY